MASAKPKSGRIASDYLIMERRRREDQRQFYQETVKDEFKVRSKANWEQATGNRIEENQLQARMSALQIQVGDHLDARRQKYAACAMPYAREY